MLRYREDLEIQKVFFIYTQQLYIYITLWRRRQPSHTHACCQPTILDSSNGFQSLFVSTETCTPSDAYTHIHMYSVNVSST